MARRSKCLFVALMVVPTVFCPTSAHATSIAYTSLAAFDAATTGLTFQTITFTAPSSTTFQFFNPYTDGATGTTFSTPSPGGVGLDVTGRNFYSPTLYPEDFLITSSANLGPETITFPANVEAVGFDYGSFNGGPLTFTLSSGGSFSLVSPTFGHLGFVGFTSTSAISSIVISEPSVIDPIVLGDLEIGTPTVVPEPASLTLLGGSAMLLAKRLRRRRVIP